MLLVKEKNKSNSSYYEEVKYADDIFSVVGKLVAI